MAVVIRGTRRPSVGRNRLARRILKLGVVMDIIYHWKELGKVL